MCSQATLSTPRKIYYKWKNVAYCFLCGSTSNPDRFTNINSACGKRKALAEKLKMCWALILKKQQAIYQFAEFASVKLTTSQHSRLQRCQLSRALEKRQRQNGVSIFHQQKPASE